MKKDKLNIIFYIIYVGIFILGIYIVYLTSVVYKIEKGRYEVTISTTTPPELDLNIGKPVDPTVIASKNGEKYHFPWCASGLRIKEELKIVFKDASEARLAGYTPAANCKGLE